MLDLWEITTSAITITENLVQHSKIKHIDISYHFIKEHVMNGTVELHFVPSEKQLADILDYFRNLQIIVFLLKYIKTIILSP